MPAPEGAGEQAPTAGAPILIVDDEAPLRQVIRWALEDEGFLVETASEGRQAVEMFTRRRPALLVLDWSLPFLNGDEVAAALRSAYGEAVPILLISADGRAAQKARSVGAVDYLHKPFDIDELLATVHSAVGAR